VTENALTECWTFSLFWPYKVLENGVEMFVRTLSKQVMSVYIKTCFCVTLYSWTEYVSLSQCVL